MAGTEALGPGMGYPQPLVSVAVITRDQKSFLVECLESVLAQDYRNLQIVVGDDASTDGTRDLLRSYQSRFPGRFTLVLHAAQVGITGNCQAVHRACSGEFIAWMGGDDLMLPGKLSRQVELLVRDPGCSMVYHDMEVFVSETGRSLGRFNAVTRPRQGGIATLIKYGTFNAASATMVRRSATPPGGFDPSLPVASDWLFWIETAAGGGSIRYIPEVLGKYRRHSKNATNPDSGQIGQGRVDALATCQILLVKYPDYFPEIMYRYARLLYAFRHSINPVLCPPMAFAMAWLAYGFGLLPRTIRAKATLRRPV